MNRGITRAMDMLSLLIGVVLGAIGAAGVVWALGRGSTGRLEEQIAALNRDLEEREAEAHRLRTDEQRLEAEVTRLHGEGERLRATLESERTATADKLKLLTDARDQLRQEFENLAHKIFDDKSRKFAGESRERLLEILSPLRDQLGDFRKKVEDVYDREGKERASLQHEIRMLKDLNQKISDEAVSLTRALKGESKTRGTWGEMILERVLEQSGLQPGREYDTQVHLHDRFGGSAARYPDVVVHLPDNRDVIIDAKVTLNAYERYATAEEPADKAAALKDHVAAVRGHVRDLSSKRYQDLDGIHPLERVILCIPVEPAFIAAVAEDPGLHEEAFGKNILLVGPTTLLLTLKIIDTIWRTEDQNRNAMAIAERGQRLYEKFVGFVEDLEAVGASLDKARASYDAAHGKLTSGSGNLAGQAQKLIDLGVKANKQLPERLTKQES